MTRDGATTSIWQYHEPDYQPANNWNKTRVYDVLIVGGGITGITTALLLQLQGKNCILAEAHTIGFGTTSGTTAHLNTLLDTPYTTIEKNFGKDGASIVATTARDAINLIEGFVRNYDIDCSFVYQPAFLFSENDAETKELNKIFEAAKRAGLAIDYIDQLPFNTSFDKALRVEKQAKFHPIKYIRALAEAYEKAGGVLLQHAAVQQPEYRDYFEASTTLGIVKAAKIVYATHIPPGINLLHFRNAAYRSYAAAFKIQNQEFGEGLVYDMKDPYHYLRLQDIEGESYLIGGGFDHKTGHNENTNYVFTELEAWLHERFSFEHPDFHWSSQYYQSADGLPYIGALPGHEQIYTGTGFGGNGMIFGTLTAIILSDLLSDKENTLYENLFDPSRIKPIAGFAEFVKENADVVLQFVGKRFAYEAIEELAALAPGEARLAEYENHKLAIYKDENGQVTAVNPVCTHAKCIVGWNNAEKSWDCPCHGGRFAPDGTVLTGPPRQALEPVIWKQLDGD